MNICDLPTVGIGVLFVVMVLNIYANIRVLFMVMFVS